MPELSSGVSTAGLRRPAATATITKVAAAISETEAVLRWRWRAVFRMPRRATPTAPCPRTAAECSPSSVPAISITPAIKQRDAVEKEEHDAPAQSLKCLALRNAAGQNGRQDQHGHRKQRQTDRQRPPAAAALFGDGEGRLRRAA